MSKLMGCAVYTAKRYLYRIKDSREPEDVADEEIGNLIWLYREEKKMSKLLRELKKEGIKLDKV